MTRALQNFHGAARSQERRTRAAEPDATERATVERMLGFRASWASIALAIGRTIPTTRRLYDPTYEASGAPEVAA
jgi:hypothetical protein